MKIRSGFVANSSSSSFIVIGFKIEEIGSKLASHICKTNPYGLYWIKDFANEEEYIGFYLMDFGEHPNLSVEDLDAEFKKYQLNKKNLLKVKEEYNLNNIVVEQIITTQY